MAEVLKNHKLGDLLFLRRMAGALAVPAGRELKPALKAREPALFKALTSLSLGQAEASRERGARERSL